VAGIMTACRVSDPRMLAEFLDEHLRKLTRLSIQITPCVGAHLIRKQYTILNYIA